MGFRLSEKKVCGGYFFVRLAVDIGASKNIFEWTKQGPMPAYNCDSSLIYATMLEDAYLN